MSAKSTDESYEDYIESINYNDEAEKRAKLETLKECEVYDRAKEYVDKHTYVCSFLNSAQGYEVLTRFMVEFSKLERKL
jgi:hypothetical protein